MSKFNFGSHKFNITSSHEANIKLQFGEEQNFTKIKVL